MKTIIKSIIIFNIGLMSINLCFNIYQIFFSLKKETLLFLHNIFYGPIIWISEERIVTLSALIIYILYSIERKSISIAKIFFIIGLISLAINLFFIHWEQIGQEYYLDKLSFFSMLIAFILTIFTGKFNGNNSICKS